MESVSEKTTLSNGVRIVSEYMPHVRSVCLGAWLDSGSRDENLDNNGICHLLEHMTFKGTIRRNTAEIAESLESVGGMLNAFTSKEFTCYYANVLDEHTELAVDVIADLVSNPIIDEDEIQKEKQVVIEEINSLEDTPEELIHEYFQKDIFQSHPLALSILGSEKNLPSISREKILDFRSAHYTSQKLVITAAGNIDHSKLCEYISKYIQLPEGTESERKNEFLPTKKNERVYRRNVSQAHICIGNRSIPYKDTRKYSLLVLHALLGGGMSSRLFQNIREKHGVAYSVFTFTDFLSDTGLFGVYVGVDKSNIEQSQVLIAEDFERVKNETLSKNELQKLQCQLKGSLMLGLESAHSRMSRLAKMELYLQNHFSLDKVLEGIDSVSSNDMQSIAQEILDEEITTTMIVPK